MSDNTSQLNKESVNNQQHSEKRQVRIAYMVNPNPVFFNELDYKLMDEIRSQGAEVVQISFETIYFKFSDKIELYHNEQPLHIDGFISYGHMSPQNFDHYQQLVKILESMGVVCLYSSKEIDILYSKLNQAICFAKHQVPIPKTFTAYTVQQTKSYYYSDLKDKAVVKVASDYGGDGIRLSKHPDEGITYFSKFQWNNARSISQEFVPDVWGKSIRVLFINGKNYGCVEVNEKSGDFRSNVSFHGNYFLPSLMDSPKLEQYREAAKKAVDSISPNAMIVGVDLVDSQSKGVIVLEVNMWPDMYDISESTKIPIFQTLASQFYQRVSENCSSQK